MIEKLRAELDWSMRNESQEQRRMKTLLAVVGSRTVRPLCFDEPAGGGEEEEDGGSARGGSAAAAAASKMNLLAHSFSRFSAIFVVANRMWTQERQRR